MSEPGVVAASSAEAVGHQNQVSIFDTTLRDGEQAPGIALTKAEKVEIAEQLARLQVDILEAGFPISSQGEFEAGREIADGGHRPGVAAPAPPPTGGVRRAARAREGRGRWGGPPFHPAA